MDIEVDGLSFEARQPHKFENDSRPSVKLLQQKTGRFIFPSVETCQCKFNGPSQRRNTTSFLYHSTQTTMMRLLSVCFFISVCSALAERGLKGGGGGGGAGVGGGSSSSGTNGGGGDNDSEAGELGLPGIIITSIAFFLGIVGSCWYLKKKAQQEMAEFQGQVGKTRADLKVKCFPLPSLERPSPHSGEYTTEYVDRGITRSGTLTLEFSDNDMNGYTISGKGSDVDGETVIEDGHANYDGMAWWVERNMTGDVGMQVLSTGTFDFDAHTFQGDWHSSTGVRGAFKSFCAKDAPTGAMQDDSDVVVARSDGNPSDVPPEDLDILVAPSDYERTDSAPFKW